MAPNSGEILGWCLGASHLQKTTGNTPRQLSDRGCRCQNGKKFGDFSQKEREYLARRENLEDEKKILDFGRSDGGCGKDQLHWNLNVSKSPAQVQLQLMLTAGYPLARGRARLLLVLARPRRLPWVRGSGHAGADEGVSAIMCREGRADWALLCGWARCVPRRADDCIRQMKLRLVSSPSWIWHSRVGL